MTKQPDSPSLRTRFRSRHSWLDHLVRAGERYTETHGNHYAAAITYFSLLALVPLLMVAFASVTFRWHGAVVLPPTLSVADNSHWWRGARSSAQHA